MDLIRPSVRKIHEYTLRQYDFEVKLNQNESPFDLPDWLKNEIVSELRDLSWNRYPGFNNQRLTEKLARHIGVAPDSILLGNGSNELLQLLVSASLEKEDTILLVTPTFLIYKQLAEIAGADILEVEFNEDWSFPVTQITEKLAEKEVRLCVLCSPNSPTGVTLDPTGLEQVAQACDGILLVDEAYFEFAETGALALQSSYPNIVVARTFSKAMGLAGLRLGYLVAEAALAGELRKAKLPYNLNIATELAACKLLEHYQVIEENIRILNAERDRVANALRGLPGVTVFPSHANFLMIETAHASGVVLNKLLEKGVLVRDISGYHPRLKNKLRLSIGTAEENEKLLAGLTEMFACGSET